MKRVCVLALCALLLTACARSAAPANPITQRIHASVTAEQGEEEYRLDVEKDSDEVATYTFSYPESVKGLTYSYLGEACTVSFHGLAIALADCPNGVADRLHEVLTAKTPPAYQKETKSYSGETENLSYRMFTLSDGNVSVIRLEKPKICYYFQYTP